MTGRRRRAKPTRSCIFRCTLRCTSSSPSTSSSKCFGKTADGYLTLDGVPVLVDDKLVKVDAGDGAGGPAAGFADGNPQGVPALGGQPEPGGAQVALSTAPQDIAAGMNAKLDALLAQGSPAVGKMAAGSIPPDATGNLSKAAQIAKAMGSYDNPAIGGNPFLAVQKGLEISGDMETLQADVQDAVKDELTKAGIGIPADFMRQYARSN